MTIENVKKNLNKTVQFTNPKLYLDKAKYILSGCIIRRGEQGFYYQAELTERFEDHECVMICRLEEIEEVTIDKQN